MDAAAAPREWHNPHSYLEWREISPREQWWRLAIALFISVNVDHDFDCCNMKRLSGILIRLKGHLRSFWNLRSLRLSRAFHPMTIMNRRLALFRSAV